MGMMINRRRAYGGKSLPYDAEVEYLESVNSEQYIDTGIIVSSPYSIYGKFLAIGKQLPNNAYVFFGAGISYNYYNIECFTAKAAQYISVLHNNYEDFAYPYNTIPFTVHYRNKEFTVTNGQDTFQYTFTNASVETPFTMGLFALHRRTWIGSPKPVRCYWFKIEDENGVTLIDLIPVRVGTTGYMYDKVSGQLFGNIGTGDFVLGPDKT